MFLSAALLIGYFSCLPIVLYLTDDYLKIILLYTHAIGACILAYFLCLASNDQANSSGGKDDLYGLRHVLFNLELPPKTMWFNMGLWNKEGISFPTACENLVHAVIKRLNMKTHSRVLDVGFGCGDSCILLAEQYHCSVTGITNELSQYRIAEKRVSSQKHLNEKIQLLHGSADDLQQLLPSNSSFDYILSIDSAYHYNTRWHFLKNAFEKLKGNCGSVGLYDIALDSDMANGSSKLKQLFIRGICRAVRIPYKNLVTVEEYKRNAETIGYSEIEIEELDRKVVFGGIAIALAEKNFLIKQYGIGVGFSNRVFLKGSSYVFGLLARKPFLVPVIVKCSRKDWKKSTADFEVSGSFNTEQ